MSRYLARWRSMSGQHRLAAAAIALVVVSVTSAMIHAAAEGKLGVLLSGHDPDASSAPRRDPVAVGPPASPVPEPTRTRRPARPAAYMAKVLSSLPVNPADLAVTVRVRNTGTEAGTPSCTVNANDPSYAYTGIDIATLKDPLPGGQVWVFTDNLVITSQGSAYITSVKVNCS